MPEHKHRLMVVAHAPSVNTRRLVEAVLAGARNEAVSGVDVRHVPPLEATPEDVLAADAIVLGTTENLGYMAGALKDFFDRCYEPCRQRTEGLRYGLYIRAGQDGTGTLRAIDSICTGLRWKQAFAPVICRGNWSDEFIDHCQELGLSMAAGLEAGLI